MFISKYLINEPSFSNIQKKINEISSSKINFRKLNYEDLKNPKKLNCKTKKHSSNFIYFQKMVNSIFQSRNDPIKFNGNINLSEKNIRPANSKMKKEDDNNFIIGYNQKYNNIIKKFNQKKIYTYKGNNNKNNNKNIQFLKKVDSFSKDLKRNFSFNDFINNRPVIEMKKQKFNNEFSNNLKYIHLKYKDLDRRDTRSLSNLNLSNDTKYMILKEYYSIKSHKKSRNNNIFKKSNSNLNINFKTSYNIKYKNFLKEYNNKNDIDNFKNSFNIKQ